MSADDGDYERCEALAGIPCSRPLGDGLHCEHWWRRGEACCWCGADDDDAPETEPCPALTESSPSLPTDRLGGGGDSHEPPSS